MTIKLTKVLNAMTKCKNILWYTKDGDGANWPFYEFSVAMIEAELISSERVMKYWWKNLILAGYLKKLNDVSAKTDPIKIANRLGIDPPKPAVKEVVADGL